MAIKGIYTTGSAANVLGLAPRTVSGLYEHGHLKGFKLPASEKGDGDRRIYESSIQSFLGARGYDFELEEYASGKFDVVMPEGFLTSGEAAKILGVSPASANKYLIQGIVKGYTLPASESGGNCHRFCRKSLLEQVTKSGRLDGLDDSQLQLLGVESPTDTVEEAA
ncbi:MAG: helix-turn-helix domain-containing protein [Candidatus Nanoarchaeia archaeon]|nr:helix-turn-helix domain-containing protein [Candidatus Nanoarchaeia archaeon]